MYHLITIALLFVLIYYQRKGRRVINTELFKIKLHQIQNQKIMEEILASIGELGGSLENIAADIARLAAGNEGGLTAEQTTTIANGIRDLAARAKAIADVTPE